MQRNTQAGPSKQLVCSMQWQKNKHTHTIASKENNWNHSARHLWSSRVPHCTYLGMSSLCACIGCMRICNLSPLLFRGGDCFTCCGSESWSDSGGCHWRQAVVILGITSLNCTEVTVASSAERTRQVQGLHGLGFYFTKNGLANWLKLAIDLSLTHLRDKNRNSSP